MACNLFQMLISIMLVISHNSIDVVFYCVVSSVLISINTCIRNISNLL